MFAYHNDDENAEFFRFSGLQSNQVAVQEKAKALTARTGSAMAAFGDSHIFLSGGVHPKIEKAMFRSVHVYDIANNVWNPGMAPDLPQIRIHHSCC